MLADFFQIVVPIGSIIATIVITILLYSLNKSFQKFRESIHLKSASMMPFICSLLYNISLVFSRLIIPTNLCLIRIPLVATFFASTRATLYYFFLIRIEISFIDTKLQFSTVLMKSLRVFVVIFYILISVANIVMAKWFIYSSENDICIPSKQILIIQYLTVGLQVLVDILVGGICVGMLFNRLCKLYAAIKIIQKTKIKLPIKQLLGLVKKQSKLLFISYLTTLTIAYWSPYLVAFQFVDSIINTLCIYCSFKYKRNEQCYNYLFNCKCCCRCDTCTCVDTFLMDESKDITKDDNDEKVPNITRTSEIFTVHIASDQNKSHIEMQDVDTTKNDDMSNDTQNESQQTNTSELERMHEANKVTLKMLRKQQIQVELK